MLKGTAHPKIHFFCHLLTLMVYLLFWTPWFALNGQKQSKNFVLSRRKKVIQVWNDMNIHSWMDYPFKTA